MKKSKKKLLAMLLAGAMVFGTLPSDAFANNEQDQTSVIVEETVTTDYSANMEDENAVEAVTEDETPATEETTETKTQAEAVSLEKTEEVIAGEKYVIVYDNKEALSVGKDQVIAVPVEVEGDTVKTEITKNMVWTVDDNNNLVSELGKKLSSELTLQENNGQSFKFNAKNVYYENGEVNTYLTYNEETNKWSFNTESNEAVTYYRVVGSTEDLGELTEEQLQLYASSNEVTEEPKVEEVNDEIASDISEDVPTVISNEDGYKYVLATDDIDLEGEYLIVASDNNKALMKNSANNLISNVDVILSDNDKQAVINRTSDLKNSLWKFSVSDTSYNISNTNGGTRYLSFGSYKKGKWSWGLNLASSSVNLNIINKGNGNYTISYTNSNNTKYLEYNTAFTLSDTEKTVRLYKKTTVEKPVKIVNFPVTMYNYDGSILNQYVNNNAATSDDKLFFRGKNADTGLTITTISSNDDGKVTQGIVKDTLTSENLIQYSSGIFGPDLFGTSSTSGKKVYKNVRFPFIYTESDGYYTFDSSAYHVHVNTENTEEQTLSLYTGQQTENIYGFGSFFPFNSGEVEVVADFHFGMNMGVGFYMPEGGLDENDNPIKFEFSGDDDVWVFIDGKLVLDLGGIHGVQGGAIDFSTGAVTYTGGRRNTSGANITTTPTNLYDIIEKENLQDDNEHSLQIFYLERGAGASNCKIKFNLPQKNKIEVSKSLVEGTPLTENEFEFKLQVKNNETNEFVAVANKKYTLYTGQGITSIGLTTDLNGTFKLKAGQRAVFNDPDIGSEYRVVEVTTSDYKTRWSTSVNGTDGTSTELSSNTKESPSIIINGTGKTNTYSFYCFNQNDIALVNDTIVLDYGKSVKIDVMTNDRAKNPDTTLTLSSIAIVSKDDNGNLVLGPFNNVDGLSLPLTNGTLYKWTTDTSADFVYAPTKYMDSIERLEYKVNYSVSNGSSGTETGEKTAKLNIIPATTVYYEDNFGNTSDDNGTNGIVFSGTFETVNVDENGNLINDTSNTNQDSGTVLTDGHPYGKDNSYTNDNKFSGGTATLIKGTAKGTNASFIFKGTGFDLISRTDSSTGSIIVTISKKDIDGEFKQVTKRIVNNIYQSGTLYQIPVINFSDVYGEYKVDITVGNTNFYLDAIRVYNPLGLSNDDNEDYSDAYTQYRIDREANAVIKEVRNMLISAKDFDVTSTNVGTIFIDVQGGDSGQNTSSVTEYKNIGPNNEVYLAKDQSIAFKVPYNSQLQTVQLGMKSTNGTAIVTVGGTEYKALDNYNINTATDMYYDITSSLTRGEDGNYIVVITNTSDTILSITNLKMTYSQPQNSATITVFSDKETVIVANMLAYEASNNKSADIDGSGTVDILDLANVASNQGKEVIIGVSTDIYKQDLTATRIIDRDDLNIVKESIK